MIKSKKNNKKSFNERKFLKIKKGHFINRPNSHLKLNKKNIFIWIPITIYKMHANLKDAKKVKIYTWNTHFLIKKYWGNS